jgi:hypothetical protein
MSGTAIVLGPAVKRRVSHPPFYVCSQKPRHAQGRIGKTYLGHQVLGSQIDVPQLEVIVVVSSLLC